MDPPVILIRCRCGHEFSGFGLLLRLGLDVPGRGADRRVLTRFLPRLKCTSCGAKGASSIVTKLSRPEAQFVATDRSKNSTFHRPDCGWVANLRREDEIIFDSAENARSLGFEPCRACHPRDGGVERRRFRRSTVEGSAPRSPRVHKAVSRVLTREMVSSDSHSFVVEGLRYEWTEKSGVTLRGITLPLVRANALLLKLEKLMEVDDEAFTRPSEIVSRASQARKMGHMKRAERLARGVLRQEPHLLGAIAVLSSVLRATQRVEESLRLTQPYHHCSHEAVLTTRAAALLDVGRSAEAVSVAKRAWATAITLNGAPAEELLNLWARLRAEGAAS